MSTKVNTITFDEASTPRVHRIAETSHRSQNRGRASRKTQLNSSRNVTKERNMSAMLPDLELDSNRYPSSSKAEKNKTNVNVLNFTKTSKRQMREMIEVQSPQAKRFYDDFIHERDMREEGADGASGKKLKIQAMPNFSNNQLSRMRPSIQSVKQQNRRAGGNSSDEQLDAKQLQQQQQLLLNEYDHRHDHQTELNSNRTRNSKRTFNARHQSHMAAAPLSSREMAAAAQGLIAQVDNLVGHALTPRRLIKDNSLGSLITDSLQNSDFKSPPLSRNTYEGQRHRSISNHRASQHSPRRDVKQLSSYLDSREMQIRTELESAQKVDGILTGNKRLEELYQQVMVQVRTKLPTKYVALSELVKRIADGLKECFEVQGKTFDKKVGARDKKIEGLEAEIVKIKEEFYDFKKNSTMDAYFKKYQDVVNRSGRSEKEYRKDLVQTVDDFLQDKEDSSLVQKQMIEAQSISRYTEPSGVDSLLIQLQNQNSDQSLPQITQNPLKQLDLQKGAVMDDFKSTLLQEGQEVRHMIEKHVRQQMGLIKPTRDMGTMTLTYKRFKDRIIEKGRFKIEQEAMERAHESFQITQQRYEEDIEHLINKNRSFKDKILNLQEKARHDITHADKVEAISAKVNEFFGKKLGKRNAHILKEFNEKVLEITADDNPSIDYSSRLEKSFASRFTNNSPQKVDKEELKRQLTNKYELLMSNAASRASNMSDENISKVVRQSTVLARRLSTESRSLGATLNKSFEEVKDVAKTEDDQSQSATGQEDQLNQSLTSIQKVALNKMRSADQSPAIVEITQKEEPSPVEKNIPEEPTSEELSSIKSEKEELKEDEQTVQEELQREIDSPMKQSTTTKGQSSRTKSPDRRYNQDEAPPSRQQTATPAEQDNRRELFAKLQKLTHGISKNNKDFQNLDKLKVFSQKADQVIGNLNKVLASAEVLSKITQLNSDETSQIRETSGILKNAFELFNQIQNIKDSQIKINDGIEMHRLLNQVNKFVLINSKKSKALPALDQIIAQTVNADRVNVMQVNLPTKKDLGQIAQLDQQLIELEIKVEEMLSRKMHKKETIKVEVPAEAVPTAPKISNDPLEAVGVSAATKTSNDPIEAVGVSKKRKLLSSGNSTEILKDKDQTQEAIGGIKLVQEQIKESHKLMLDSQSQPKDLKDQKALFKVTRLLSHMTEAMYWLEQHRQGRMLEELATDFGDLRVSSGDRAQTQVLQSQPPIIMDREKAFNQKHTKNFDLQEWSQTGSAAPVTPPPIIFNDPTNVADQSIQENLNIQVEQSEKILKVGEDARVYLAEQDIEIVQEERDQIDETRLGKIGEVIEQEATENECPPNSSSTQHYAYNSMTLQDSEFEQMLATRSNMLQYETEEQTQSDLKEAVRMKGVEGYLKTPSQMRLANQSSHTIDEREDDRSLQQVQTPTGLGNQGAQMLLNDSLEGRREQHVVSYVQDMSQIQQLSLAQKKSISQQNIHASISPKQMINQNNGDRKQFAELWQMDQTQTFSSIVETAKFDATDTRNKHPTTHEVDATVVLHKDKTARPRDLAAHLRQSGIAETDYLKTVSHFDADELIAQTHQTQQQINVGIVQKTNKNLANDTSNFLNNLKETVAVDQKKPVQPPKPREPKFKIQVKPNNQKKMQSTTHSISLNQDLAADQKLMESHESGSTGNQQVNEPYEAASSVYKHNQQEAVKDQRTPSPRRKGVIGKAIKIKSSVLRQISSAQTTGGVSVVRQPHAPSELMIKKKPINHIKVQEVGDFHYMNSYPEPIMAPVGDSDKKLMLTQETQTENRTLIKQLLTLINETLMRQLQEQSVRMSVQDFQETVNQFKAAIPAVYERIKEKSESFFMDTSQLMVIANQKQTSARNSPDPPLLMVNLNEESSNRDLATMMEETKSRAGHLKYPGGRQGSVAMPNHRTSPIKPQVTQNNQQPIFQQSSSQGALPPATEQQPMIGLVESTQHHCKKHPPEFLGLGDFSRYGNHTLELSQEIKTRVNVKQVGATGGGFLGKKVKISPPRY